MQQGEETQGESGRMEVKFSYIIAATRTVKSQQTHKQTRDDRRVFPGPSDITAFRCGHGPVLRQAKCFIQHAKKKSLAAVQAHLTAGESTRSKCQSRNASTPFSEDEATLTSKSFSMNQPRIRSSQHSVGHPRERPPPASEPGLQSDQPLQPVRSFRLRPTGDSSKQA